MRELLDRHAEFRRKIPRTARKFLRALASEGQSPDALYIGCSDSRVVPEILTRSSPGALFVVRNVANVVPPLTHPHASVGAAIEYAVGHLHVPHAIICGHYGCGGVQAAVDGVEHLEQAGLPTLARWLSDVAVLVEPVKALGVRRAVEENVERQLDHLMSYPCVAAALARDEIELHGWVYDLHSLELWVYDADADVFRRSDELLDEPTPAPA